MRRRSPGLLVGIVVAAGALATAASAADLPVPAAPAYVPPVYRPVVYDWTGIYGGVHLGVGALDDQVTTLTTTALQPAGTATRLSPFSLVSGAQAGFNVEFAVRRRRRGHVHLVEHFRHPGDDLLAADHFGKFNLHATMVCDRDRQDRLRRQ